jgi:predicted ATP-dependent endonuclease of OLD family
MADTFITKIQIDKVRHLTNLTIPLSETERRHLILTGKNGSGKTSVLEAIHTHIDPILTGVYPYPAGEQKLGSIKICCSYQKMENLKENTLVLYIPARHELDIEVPKHIETIQVNRIFGINENASKDFLKYMVDLDYQKLSADSNNDITDKERIEKWFCRFEKTLREVYDDPQLELKSVAKDKIFKIITANREPFGLNEMADGYSALLKIVMELMMRMDSKVAGVYDVPGIVLIDEIETHLHVELQKKVLPFLTTLFPNIQFIVTTHSPFVIESLKGAIVYDLERQERNVITEAKSTNETVRDILGVPLAMPIWAEQKLKAITEKYISQSVEHISFENMKKELEGAGLSSFFPESMADVLQGKK